MRSFMKFNMYVHIMSLRVYIDIMIYMNELSIYNNKKLIYQSNYADDIYHLISLNKHSFTIYNLSPQIITVTNHIEVKTVNMDYLSSINSSDYLLCLFKSSLPIKFDRIAISLLWDPMRDLYNNMYKGILAVLYKTIYNKSNVIKLVPCVQKLDATEIMIHQLITTDLSGYMQANKSWSLNITTWNKIFQDDSSDLHIRRVYNNFISETDQSLKELNNTNTNTNTNTQIIISKIGKQALLIGLDNLYDLSTQSNYIDFYNLYNDMRTKILMFL